MSRLKGILAYIRGNMPLHKGLSFSNSYADEKLINFMYHTNYCVIRGFPALRACILGPLAVKGIDLNFMST